MARPKRLSVGDTEFLTRLYLDQWYTMLHTARAVIPDYALAEDVVGDVICNLVSQVERVNTLSGVQLNAFLYVATRNRALKYTRDWIRKNALVPFRDLEDSYADPGPQMEERVAEKLDSASLLELIERHDARAAQILGFRILGEHSYAEIAAFYGISEATARSRFHRGKNIAAYIIRREERLQDLLRSYS